MLSLVIIPRTLSQPPLAVVSLMKVHNQLNVFEGQQINKVTTGRRILRTFVKTTFNYCIQCWKSKLLLESIVTETRYGFWSILIIQYENMKLFMCKIMSVAYNKLPPCILLSYKKV